MNLSNMTGSQVRAVTTGRDLVYVVAGPGSGKTTVLSKRIQRIMSELNDEPFRICAITYTNAAARNLEDRAGNVRLAYGGTLHGFCLRMLREHAGAAGYGQRVAVLDEAASDDLLQQKMASAGCKDSLKVVKAIKALGRPMRGPGATVAAFSKAQMAVLAYCDELFESGLLDFDLILTEFLRVLRKQGNLWQAIKDGFDHLMVDEVQDSAAIDWIIYRELPIAKKFLVGDPDQSIFGFRGGRGEFAIRYAQDPAVEVIYLDDNFRCSPDICAAANKLIAHNANRLPKTTVAARLSPMGQVDALNFCKTDAHEVSDVADMVRYYYTENDGDVAILARTNAIAEPFRKALAERDLLVEETPRSEMPDDWVLARAMLEFLAQPENDTLAFFYLMAICRNKGDSDVDARRYASQSLVAAKAKGKNLNGDWFLAPRPDSVTNVADHVSTWADREKLSLETRALLVEMARNAGPDATLGDLALEAARRSEPPKPKSNGGVTVTTIHDAKGREWDEVYIVGAEDEAMPGTRKDTDVEEERRLFFVALTRARHRVWITHAARRTLRYPNGFEETKDRTPSRFIKEATS